MMFSQMKLIDGRVITLNFGFIEAIEPLSDVDRALLKTEGDAWRVFMYSGTTFVTKEDPSEVFRTIRRLQHFAPGQSSPA